MHKNTITEERILNVILCTKDLILMHFTRNIFMNICYTSIYHPYQLKHEISRHVQGLH